MKIAEKLMPQLSFVNFRTRTASDFPKILLIFLGFNADFSNLTKDVMENFFIENQENNY